MRSSSCCCFYYYSDEESEAQKIKQLVLDHRVSKLEIEPEFGPSPQGGSVRRPVLEPDVDVWRVFTLLALRLQFRLIEPF